MNKPKLISNFSWPEISVDKIDHSILGASDYLKEVVKTMRTTLDKVSSGKNAKKFTKLTIVVKTEYFDW